MSDGFCTLELPLKERHFQGIARETLNFYHYLRRVLRM